MNVEILVNIFTIENGDIKLLLLKKNSGIYKGYWVLPSIEFNKNNEVDDLINELLNEKLGINKLYLEQNHTFTDINRNYKNRTISISYIGLMDSISKNIKVLDTKEEKEWFKLNEIPKLAFDHDDVLKCAKEYLKERIIKTDILKILFPSDFTLPELQKTIENILGIELDRRNFRKKIINYVYETGDINESITGRPAKLYRFKEMIDKENII